MTMFYMDGEQDIERVHAWLHSIDERWPVDTLGMVYLGTTGTEWMNNFRFKRLKPTFVAPSWIKLKD
jgi:hypothetical protein